MRHVVPLARWGQPLARASIVVLGEVDGLGDKQKERKKGSLVQAVHEPDVYPAAKSECSPLREATPELIITSYAVEVMLLTGFSST